MILNEYWELVAADLATQFVPSEGGADPGRLNCLVGRFDIENGVADATVLMIDSERVLAGGEGTVSPADKRRSEGHTSEPQAHMPIWYAVFCCKKKHNEK